MAARAKRPLDAHKMTRPKALTANQVKHTNATYHKSSIKAFEGNPFIEALGPPLSKKEMATSMALIPDYDESERNLPTYARKFSIRLSLGAFFAPLTQQHEVAQTIDEMLRVGYVNRAPRTAAYNARLQELADERVLGEIRPAPDLKPQCEPYSVIGISGVGKSKLVERALAQYPQLIWHRKIRQYQISYIIVQTPHNGLISQLVSNVFAAIDAASYTQYTTRYNPSNKTISDNINALNTAIQIHGVGLIVFDELQFVNVAGPVETEKFMNFVVTFVNRSLAPIVMVGTMALFKALGTDFRQARRGIGSILLNQEQDEEWDDLMNAMWRYQWTRKATPLTPELSAAIYERTQGVLALAKRLYQYVQRKAIDTKVEEISVDLIHEVADEYLRIVQPMVDAIASRDEKTLLKYGDLSLPDISPEEFNLSEPVPLSALLEAAPLLPPKRKRG